MTLDDGDHQDLFLMKSATVVLSSSFPEAQEELLLLAFDGGLTVQYDNTVQTLSITGDASAVIRECHRA